MKTNRVTVISLLLTLLASVACAAEDPDAYPDSGSDHMPDAWMQKLSPEVERGIEARFRVPKSRWDAWRLSDCYRGDTHQVVKFRTSQEEPMLYVRLPNKKGGSSAILEYGEKDYVALLAESLADVPSFRKLVDSLQNEGAVKSRVNRDVADDFARLVAGSRLGYDHGCLREFDREEKKGLCERHTDGSAAQREELLALCQDGAMHGSREDWQLVSYGLQGDGSAVKVMTTGAGYQLAQVKVIELFPKDHFRDHRYDRLLGMSLSDSPTFKTLIKNSPDKEKSAQDRWAAHELAKFVIMGRFGKGHYLLKNADREDKKLFETCTDGSASHRQQLLDLCRDAVMQGSRKSWQLVSYTVLRDGSAVQVVASGADYQFTESKVIEVFPKGHFRWHAK